MRKMKRFMAFVLSAVVMLTMVNTPVVTARAQSQEVASVAETEKKVEKVEIQLDKDTFAPNYLRDVAANVKFIVVYDNGDEEELSSLELNNSDVYDALKNAYRIKIDKSDFWYSDMLEPGVHTIYVTGTDGSVYGQAEINYGQLSDYTFDMMDSTVTEMDSYKYYKLTVSTPSYVSWNVDGVQNPNRILRAYTKDGRIRYSGYVFYPGQTYYLMAAPSDNNDGNGYVNRYKVSLDISELPERTEGYHKVKAESNESYDFVFNPTKSGDYEFSLWVDGEGPMEGDAKYMYSINVSDVNGTYVSSVVYSEMVINLNAGTEYVFHFRAHDVYGLDHIMIKKLMDPASASITLDKTDYVVGMDANYLKNSQLEVIDVDGEKYTVKDLAGINLYSKLNSYIDIYYSMNGGEKKELSSETPMDTEGTMTIYVMHNDEVLGSSDVNIRSYDQVEIPELKKGENEKVPLYRLYKFISPVNGTVDITSDNRFVKFNIYELKDGKFTQIESDSTLSAGVEYYCLPSSSVGYDEANINLAFDGKVKLMGVNITGFDKTLYDLGTAMLTDDRLDKMRSAIRYKLVYSDGSEVDDSNVPANAGVAVNLEKDGNDGLVAKVSCGDLSDELKIPFKAPSDAPVIAFSGNKARLGITGEGQHVYQFKAPVTGYYGLEMRMTGGYYGCYSSFYSSSELVDQPDVDMNQRLVKAGETYYVCIFAPGRLTNVKLVCTPQLTCATTTADGSIAVSKQVGTGDDAYYQIEEEKIARIKSVTLAAPSYTYDTKVKEPAVTVKDSDGEVIAASNYTVTYSNNTNVGTATAKITFKGNYAGTVKKTFTIKKFAAPAASKVTKLENTAKGIIVTWTTSANATSYEIYRSVNGGRFVKADILYIKGTGRQKTLGYADLKAKTNGGRYAYKIVAVRTLGNVTVRSAAGAAKTAYYVSAPSNIKLVNSTARTIKVTYGRNAKAAGYEIRYSLKKNMAGAKVVKTKGASAAVAKLTKNKRYYISVRSYKTVNKVTYYSAWSTSKNIVVKK